MEVVEDLMRRNVAHSDTALALYIRLKMFVDAVEDEVHATLGITNVWTKLLPDDALTG